MIELVCTPTNSKSQNILTHILANVLFALLFSADGHSNGESETPLLKFLNLHFPDASDPGNTFHVSIGNFVF